MAAYFLLNVMALMKMIYYEFIADILCTEHIHTYKQNIGCVRAYVRSAHHMEMISLANQKNNYSH